MNVKPFFATPAVICLAAFLAGAQSLDNLTPRQYANFTFTSPTDGKQMKYSVYPPAGYVKGDKKPILLYMHGTGPRATWAPEAMNLEGYPIDAYPFFLIEPFCPTDQTCWTNTGWSAGPQPMAATPTPGIRMTYELLQYLVSQLGLDSTRIYIHGNSNGGYATWDMLARWPGYFAAALPVCGAGDPSKARLMIDIPIWAWHSTDDPIVPFNGTRFMVDSLLATGGWPRYNFVSGYGHNAWDAMRMSQAEVFAWMFAQNRTTLGPPAFTTALKDTTVVECDTLALRVEFAGSGFLVWKKNGAVIAGQKGKALPLPRFTLADAGVTYTCELTNARGSATTSGRLQVTADVTRPQLLNVYPGTSTGLTLVFSEGLDAQSASTAGNYTLDNGAIVSAAAIGSAPNIVRLTTTPLSEGTSYRLAVTNVKDRAATANAVETGSAVSFVFNERQPGLHYDYYRGSLGSARSLVNSPPAKESEGVIDNFDITKQSATDNFGFCFAGDLLVTSGGLYTFYISSDDGSLLYIDTALLIDNDGDHGMMVKSGKITLTPGYHPIKVYYNQGGYGMGLKVQWEGPGFALQDIPDDVLWHASAGGATQSARRVGRSASATVPALRVQTMGSGATAFLLLQVPAAGPVCIDIYDLRGRQRSSVRIRAHAPGIIYAPIKAAGTDALMPLYARINAGGTTVTAPLVVR